MLNKYVHGIVSMGNCVPTNDTLSAPLAAPLESLIGAANGLMPWIVTAVAVVLAIAAVVAIRSDKVSALLKVIAWVLMIPIVLWFGLMIYFVITGNLVQVAECPF